ncbi:MAG: hypothetical protein HYZ74_05850, partial [Elusimicrobia bacterium]|nr:hypothetical protein [Elusimicrobiota bacterium]
TEFLHFYTPTRELFWADYADTYPQCHTATLMGFRNSRIRYPESGSFSDKGEDDAILQQYVKNSSVNILSDMPYLYVYVYHRANIWAYSHHRRISTLLAASTENISENIGAIPNWIKHFSFGKEPINVMSKDNLVAQLDPPKLAR